ncbi:hypothetical protein HBI25_096140 [Parastagonospora nodorum]|nr:hypothetical protein HBH69_116520 [Parastagonospora nodorum]KAH5562562.1 hypothetical protein HBI25_096140 [Parastagonospora nodorum]KAH5599295.1 hypothetical protein HBI26_091590 [Parastagonospora nodorum]
MVPQNAYGGPTALAYSKYASPSAKRAQPASFPAAVSSTKSAPANDTIATREQIAASHDESAIDVANHNSDAQLAIAQGNALKEEVERHAAKFSRTVSAAVTNTRQLLELIREAVQKEDPNALKSVDDLWTELEQLFEAAQGTKEALPNFLEKQRNNMALYHASVMNETYRDSQDELKMQHKKVNLQHDLILEHQQAFQDYKAQTVFKFKELDDLQERVSRLTLEKGNFREEIDKYAKMLEHEQSTKAEDFKKVDALQGQLESLVDSKKQMLAEVDGLQKTIGDLKEKMHSAEQQLTDRFTTELKEKTDLLAKETAKVTNLNSMISNLRTQESNVKMEMNKLSAESKLINDKYNHMASEHSQAFSKGHEQNKKIETLTVDAERLRKEGDEMKSRMAKLSELEAQYKSLFKEKAGLLETVGKLTDKVSVAENNCAKANKELSSLTDKLQRMQADNEAQKNENSKLLAKQETIQAEKKEAALSMQGASDLKQENDKLKVLVGQLKADQAAPPVGGAPAFGTDTGHLIKIKDLEIQKEKLEKALGEWTQLAQRSYKEYKEMLPTYKQAEQHRFAAEDAENQIKTLRQDLASARASRSNGASSGGDAAYWKNKYDGLLANIGN